MPVLCSCSSRVLHIGKSTSIFNASRLVTQSRVSLWDEVWWVSLGDWSMLGMSHSLRANGFLQRRWGQLLCDQNYQNWSSPIETELDSAQVLGRIAILQVKVPEDHDWHEKQHPKWGWGHWRIVCCIIFQRNSKRFLVLGFQPQSPLSQPQTWEAMR